MTWDEAAEGIAEVIYRPGTAREFYDRGAWIELARWAHDRLSEYRQDMTAAQTAKFLAGKQHDYGTENIMKFGVEGLKVRIWDKVARYENLTRREAEGFNESMGDTLQDIIGYVIIMLMISSPIDDQGGTLFELPLKVDLVDPDTDADVEAAYTEAGAAEVKSLLERWNEGPGPYSTEDWQVGGI